MDSDPEILELEQNNNVDEIMNETVKEKPKLDRRKATSKANMQKARLAKLAQQAQARKAKANTQTYNVYDSESSEDDESDEEDVRELVIQRSKPKTISKGKSSKATKSSQPNKEMSEIKSMMAMLLKAQMKAKKKPEKKQINVQLPAPTIIQHQQPKTLPANSRLVHMKNELLDL